MQNFAADSMVITRSRRNHILVVKNYSKVAGDTGFGDGITTRVQVDFSCTLRSMFTSIYTVNM